MKEHAGWLDVLILESRQAFRGLRSSPGFVVTVVLTLGLGIGANAGVFEMVDQLLLRPPPYLVDSESVHRLNYLRNWGDDRLSIGSYSYPGYRLLAERAAASDDIVTLAAQAERDQVATLGGRPRQILVLGVSASYWELFRMAPAAGRFFGPEDDQLPAGERVAVLAHHLWRTRFAADPDVIGHSIAVGDGRYTIIGVAPAGFRGLKLRTPDVYVPLTAAGGGFVGEDFAEAQGTTWLTLAIRTAEGASGPALTTMTRAVIEHQRARRGDEAVRELDIVAEYKPAQTNRASAADTSSRFALWLLGMSAILVLGALANVGTLLTGRRLRRRKDTAIRAAVGMPPGRIMLLPILETVMLSLLAGVAAVPIGHATVIGVVRLLLPRYADAISGLAPRSVLYGMAVMLVAGLLAAVLPALRSPRTDPGAALRSGRGAGRMRSRAQTLLPVVQAALSAILLVGAGLFVRSVSNGQGVQLGFSADRILVADPVTNGAFDVFAPAEEFGYTLDGVQAAAEAVAGVEAVAVASTPPFLNNQHTALILASGDTAPPVPENSASRPHNANFNSGPGNYSLNQVTPAYFRVTGTPIVMGRGFEPGDREGGEPVVVVSESVARRVWPADNPAGHDAIGQCARLGVDTLPCARVVGIAGDVRRGSIRSAAAYQVYAPWGQGGGRWRGTFVIRTAGPAAPLLGPVGRALQAAVPASVLMDVRPMDAIVGDQLRTWTVGARVFGLFGLLALAMAAIGLFSVVAYEVSQRTHEFGVRMAFGAVTRDLVALVLRKGLTTTAAGAGIGLLVAALLATRIQDMLFDVPGLDPLTFGGVAGLLLGTAVLASLRPALRAGRSDPRDVLQTE